MSNNKWEVILNAKCRLQSEKCKITIGIFLLGCKLSAESCELLLFYALRLFTSAFRILTSALLLPTAVCETIQKQGGII